VVDGFDRLGFFRHQHVSLREIAALGVLCQLVFVGVLVFVVVFVFVFLRRRSHRRGLHCSRLFRRYLHFTFLIRALGGEGAALIQEFFHEVVHHGSLVRVEQVLCRKTRSRFSVTQGQRCGR
jgi:hypothetical protein